MIGSGTNQWLLTGGKLATMQPGKAAYGTQEASLLINGNKIERILTKEELSEHGRLTQVNVEGAWIFPGFIDAHTHMVFAGSRAQEFERLLKGESYQDIAASGGGIMSTVKATRECSEERLFELASKRLNAWLREGVTTVEIKSGYGLDLLTETKMLRVAKALERHFPIRVHTTFLGAHALPSEYKGRADDYIQQVTQDWLPALVEAGLVDSVDVFCESIGFSLTQTQSVFEAARSLGLLIRAHVEQLSHLGGAKLAADMGALSVDHIEYLLEEEAGDLARAGTVATLLPVAFYHLSEQKIPPIEALRAHKVPMAVASDFNPGSAPLASLLLAANMSSRFFKLTPEEALQGITVSAAKALGAHHLGVLQAGAAADFSVWEIQHPSDLVYSYGISTLKYRCFGGEMIKMNSDDLASKAG